MNKINNGDVSEPVATSDDTAVNVSNEHTLKYPFTAGGGELVEKIVFQPVTVKQMRKAINSHKSEFDQDFALFAASSGLVPEDLDKMDVRDFTAAMPCFRNLIRI